MKGESLQQKLGKRLRKLRTARGWSQNEFADRCGINHSHMGEIERGELDVALSTLAKIAKGLEMNAREILEGIV